MDVNLYYEEIGYGEPVLFLHSGYSRGILAFSGQIQPFYAAGYRVWASLEPVIDFKASLKMLHYAINAGCQHFKIGLMTKNTKVCRHGFTLDGKKFPPYDPAECLAFVQDVMVATEGRATVYWKQSVRDFIGGTPAHRLFTDKELHDIFDNYSHSVTKDWSMFNNQ